MISNVSALHAGFAGMQAARERLDASARELARDPVGRDLPEHLVGLLTARHAFAAGAAVVRAADEMTGTLLDVFG